MFLEHFGNAEKVRRAMEAQRSLYDIIDWHYRLRKDPSRHVQELKKPRGRRRFSNSHEKQAAETEFERWLLNDRVTAVS